MFEIIYHTCDQGNGWCNIYAIARDGHYYVLDVAEEDISKFKTLSEALDNCAKICQPTSRLLKRQLASVVENKFTVPVTVSVPTCVSIYYNEVTKTEAVLSLLPTDHREAIRHIAKEVQLNRPDWTIPELKSVDDALHLWVSSTTNPTKTQSLNLHDLNPLDIEIWKRMFKETDI